MVKIAQNPFREKLECREEICQAIAESFLITGFRPRNNGLGKATTFVRIEGGKGVGFAKDAVDSEKYVKIRRCEVESVVKDMNDLGYFLYRDNNDIVYMFTRRQGEFSGDVTRVYNIFESDWNGRFE